MSFESPSGAPAPEDTPAPLTPPYQQAPPFQGAPQGAPPFQGTQGTPQFGAAPYPTYATPYAGYQSGPVKAPNAALPIVVTVLSGLYVVLCLVEIFALNHRVSLANSIIADPTSVTIDQANSADNTVSALSVAAIVVFLAIIVLLIVWQRSLRTALAPTGRYQEVLRASGYQIFRGVWVVSILLALVLRGSGNLDTPQAVVSHDHEYMVYYGLRAVLAGVLIFFALRLKRTVDNAFTAAVPQVGYGAGGPVYPQS
jgi:hypothetical protein